MHLNMGLYFREVLQNSTFRSFSTMWFLYFPNHQSTRFLSEFNTFPARADRLANLVEKVSMYWWYIQNESIDSTGEETG